MNILIVDDEPLARKRLARLVEEIGGHTLLAEAGNGKDALLRSGELNPDIVLLDVRMPEMDGIETARQLARLTNPPAVIFTTAFSEHALHAFDAHAIDYLVKPIRKERLEQALAKAHKLNRAQLAALTQDAQPQSGRSHLNVTTRGNIELIPIEEVIFFQADQKYVRVRSMRGEALIEDSLKQLEDEFPQRFLRIHRNAIVGVDFISGIEKDALGRCFITLRGCDEKLEISRRLLPDVRRHIKS
jgi:two-component system, LytTR family, response regulator AlgR